MTKIDSTSLRNFSERIFIAAKATRGDAALVSELLVRANLCGVDSHGVIRIPDYVKRLEDGLIRPGKRPKIIKETSVTALLDAQFGFGQVSGIEAMKVALRKARENALSAVTVFNCNHVGRLADYPMMALEHDMFAMVACKGFPCNVAPWGGASGVLSTSPLSFAIPAGKERPIVADFATSVVAEGKIRVKNARGEKIPLGWILGPDGKPSSDPGDYYRGGVLLTFGQHKGYAINLLAEALGGALSGGGVSTDFKGVNGLFIFVLDVEEFIPLKDFKDSMDALIKKVKAANRAEGFSQILVPGEPEIIESERRMREGISVEEKTWMRIVEVANQLGVPVPKT